MNPEPESDSRYSRARRRFKINPDQLIGNYRCNQCGRSVYTNSHTWLHSDDQTPVDTCTGYPMTNVNVVDSTD